MLSGGYITPQGAANLATYAYSGQDKSLIANYILKHFWNWAVEFIPTWVAPNVVTLWGLMCMGISFYIVTAYCEVMHPCELPGWAYIVISLLIFAYQTFDNLDGKQARRTGSSSALGEVFDHGGDSLTIPIFTLILSNAVQFGPFEAYITLIYLSFVFFAVHWEGYFTGTVVLDIIANPTEAQLSMISLLIITYFYGNSVWLTQVDTSIFGTWQLNHILLAMSCLIAIQGTYTQFLKIRAAAAAKGLPARSVIMFLLPMCLVFATSAVWVYFSPEILQTNPRLFICTFGWLASYVSMRQIVHSVCKEPFKLYYNVLTPAIFAVLLVVVGQTVAPILDESFILKGLFVVVILNVGMLVVSLISEFCRQLDIWAFSIKPKAPPLGGV
eukprot:TRINITY_DN7294_c0_g1_i1.p1 TRINITY_DN7294_c0_g1~~TRINITY_DN7294_c0_g1_i1.p1  ORF type:complete len:385 (+),score=11.73 TRINITY_DN7294_c0_g1_i1:141-1295(+)